MFWIHLHCFRFICIVLDLFVLFSLFVLFLAYSLKLYLLIRTQCLNDLLALMNVVKVHRYL